MRRLLPIIAIALVYAMTPGALELTENVVHLLHHGDTAHAGADHADDEPSDEHGCSGTYHACTCHSTVRFLDDSLPPVIVAPTTTPHAELTGPVALLDSGFVRGIDRPPQA